MVFLEYSLSYSLLGNNSIDEPREEQYDVMCLDTAISGPRLIRAWKRRHWIEYCFRTLKHLLATGACQVHNENAYYGHLVLRLMGCLALQRHLIYSWARCRGNFFILAH